jgi:hypothetical protein
MADGSQHQRAVYMISNLCIASMCAQNVPVTFEDSDSLLGADFFQAAHASLAINDGVMTLSAAH